MPPGVGYDKYFRSKSGDFVDKTGTVVADPATRLSISESIGGDIGKLPLYVSPEFQNLPSPTAAPIDPSSPPVPTPTFTPPSPNAPTVGSNYVTSLTADLEAKRKQVENSYAKELERIKADQAQAQKQQDLFARLQEDVLDDVEEIQAPFRADLEKTERERLKVEENYFANQALVEELGSLLTSGNEAIKRAQQASGPSALMSRRLGKTLSDIASRTGVIEATMAARNGQIAQAYNLIDRSVTATVADREDQLTYYKSLFDFYQNQKDDEGNKLLDLTREERRFVDAQIGLLEGDLKNAQATAEYVKGLMVSPESAAIMAESGVTLNDDVATINKKLADYTVRQQRDKYHKQNKAELEAAGVQTMFVDRGGEWQRVSDGYAFESPEEFQRLTGMTMAQAAARGMVSKFVSADRQAFEVDKSITEREMALREEQFDFERELALFELTNPDDDDQPDPNATLDIDDIKKLTDMGYEVTPGTTYGDLQALQPTKGLELKTEALTSARQLLERFDSGFGSGKSAVGMSRLFGLQYIPGTPAANFKIQFDNLKSLLSLDSIKYLKGTGAISDSEQRLLAAAASKLNLGMSESEFKKTLEELIGSLGSSGGEGSLRWKDPSTGQEWEFPDQKSLDQFKKDNGISFNQVGNTKASTPYLKTLGSITGYGSPIWKYGLDVDLKKGDPVKSPVSGKIIAADKGYNSGFGNNVRVQDANGRIWRLSHLDALSVKPGQTIRAGQLVGRGGNTGKVIASRGGDGSHLDITVYQNGKPIPAKNVKELLDRIFV